MTPETKEAKIAAAKIQGHEAALTIICALAGMVMSKYIAKGYTKLFLDNDSSDVTTTIE